MNCEICGEKIEEGVEKCSLCGAYIKENSVKYKNPRLAAIFSFFIPGLGHFYIRQLKSGFAYIIISLAVTYIIEILKNEKLYGLFFVFWLFNVYDAYKSTAMVNKTAKISHLKL